MRCEDIAECFDFKTGKLTTQNKFKSFVCRYRDILDKKKRKKIIHDKSVKAQAKGFSKFTKFERDLVITALRMIHFRETQFEEIIKKLEYSNYLEIV